MRSIYTFLLTGALALSMSATALAKDHHERSERHDRRDARHDVRHDAHQRAYRDARYNDHDRDDRRKGWDKGKKTGWHGNSVPPGQAKRHHDRDDWTRRHHHRSHHSHATYARNTYPTNNRTPVTPAPQPTRTAPPTTQHQHGRGPLPVPNTGGQAAVRKPSGQNPMIAQAR